jgi:hypothetical protein
VAKIAAKKVRIPAIEAVIERGESVWYVYMVLGTKYRGSACGIEGGVLRRSDE